MLYEATLVNGRSYHAFGHTFLQGVPGTKHLTKAQKEELEGEAVDIVKTMDGDRLPRQKFEFRAIKDGKAAPAATKKAGGDGDGADESGEGEQAAPAARSRRRAEG